MVFGIVIVIILFKVMIKSMKELTNRSHGDKCPPETQWNWAKVIWRVDLNPFRIINKRGKDDDAKDQEEDEEHQLLGGRPERLQQDLQPGWVTCQLEQPEDPDDGEELEDVGVLDMGDVLLEEEVGVEADGGDVVNHVHRRLQKVALVGTWDEPVKSSNLMLTIWSALSDGEFILTRPHQIMINLH